MLTKAFTGLEQRLEGWPSTLLTIALLVAAGLMIMTAIRGSNSEKALTLAYVIFP